MGREQIVDEQLRQPCLIARRFPALLYHQHAIDIIADQRLQHVGRFLKRQARTQLGVFLQIGNQPGLVLTPSRLDLARQVCQFGRHCTGRSQQFQRALNTKNRATQLVVHRGADESV